MDAPKPPVQGIDVFPAGTLFRLAGVDTPLPFRMVRITYKQLYSQTGPSQVPQLEHLAFDSVDAMVRWMLSSGFDPKRHNFDRLFFYHESQGLIPDLTYPRLIERLKFHQQQQIAGES